MNKYQFVVIINVNNCESKVFEEALKMDLCENTMKNNAEQLNNSKFLFKKGEFNDIHTDLVFDDFIAKNKDNFLSAYDLLKEYNGSWKIRIVFEELNEKPFMELSKETTKFLYDINCGYNVDY